MENENIKVTKEDKSWRGLFEGYADEWVREGIALVKRLRLAITLIVVGWLAFLVLLSVLLIMAVAR